MLRGRPVPSAVPRFGLFTFALWFLQHPDYVTVFTHMYFPLQGIFPRICKESILKLIYWLSAAGKAAEGEVRASVKMRACELERKE